MTVAVSVIIPTYRRFEYALDTVETLLRQKGVEFEVIVADQNVDWPAREARRLQHIKRDHRLMWLHADRGVVGARHFAVQHAKGEILVFVDDDVIIDDVEFLSNHLKNYADLTVDAIVGRELSPSRPVPKAIAIDLSAQNEMRHLSLVEQALGLSREGSVRREVCCFCTCNSSVRKSSFFRVGGFDEWFQGASYGDDYDFALRLCASGGRIIFDPQCSLVHLRAPTGGLRMGDPRNDFSERDKALSGLIFVMRHARGPLFAKLLYSWVLRRTILRKQNVLAPWRLPRAFSGLVSAYFEARAIVARGPKSRFAATQTAGTRRGKSSATVH